MSILMLLFPLLMLVALVTFVWLVVLAFKRHVGWGVCVLLLSPIAAIVFAVKHWREVRTPFLLHAGSFVGAAVLGVATLARVGAGLMGVAQQEAQAEMRRVETQAPAPIEASSAPAPGPVVEEHAADAPVDAAVIADGDAAGGASRSEAERILDSMAAPPELAAPATAAPAAAPAALAGGAAVADDLALLVGQKVRVRTKSGGLHRGRLTQVGASGILLDIDLGSGSVSYELDFDEIDSVRASAQ